VYFDYPLGGHEEIAVWFTLFTIIAYLIGIPLGILVLLIALLILLPIHIGGAGYYRQNEYAASGWIKALAGLVGVVFDYTDAGGKYQVVFGKWVIWQPKEGESEPAPPKDTFQEPVSAKKQTDVSPPQAVRKRTTDETVTPSVKTPLEEIKRPDTRFSEIPNTNRPPSVSIEDEGDSLQIVDESNDDEAEGAPSWWARWKVLRVQLSRYWGYSQEARPILWRFLKRLMRILRFRYVDVDVMYGADDPAQTGRLFGYVEAIRPLLGKRTSLVLTPDFTRSCLEGAGALEVSFYLSRFLWAVLMFSVRGGVLGAKIWWRERRVKRQAALSEVS